jgi:large subunit ribosomal protein L23
MTDILLSNKNLNSPSNSEFNEWRSLMKTKLSPVMMMADFVKYPVITEKTFISLFRNKAYTFDVDLRLTKPQIKKLFEKLFNVNVIAMNTHRPPRQKRRAGLTKGYKPRYKRVIITLKEGQSLYFD